MKNLLCFLLCFLGCAQLCANDRSFSPLAEQQLYQSMGALAALKAFAGTERGPSNTLRLILIKALAEAHQGKYSKAKQSIVQARSYLLGNAETVILRRNPFYANEIKITEFDIKTLEGKE